MRTLLIALVMVATPCMADEQTLYGQYLAENRALIPSEPVYPVYPVPVNPWPIVGPAAQPRNIYGTGYSIVTVEREVPNYMMQYMGERGATTRETVTSVVPNNAWGQPVRPLVPFYPY